MELHLIHALKREMDDTKWRQRTRDLEMLEVGTPVSIQNQSGNNPTKWDKTGVILENKPHSQVLIRVDGSRRVTTRNRRFIRQLDPRLRTPNSPRTVLRKRNDEVPEKVTDMTAPKARAATHDEGPPVEQEQQVHVQPQEQPVHHQQDPAPQNAVLDQYGGFTRNRLEDCPQQGGVNDLLEWAIPAAPGVVGDEDHVQDVEPVAVPDAENVLPAQVNARPRRAKQPNTKYSPDVYDLSYIGSRNRSRKSIRRAGN